MGKAKKVFNAIVNVVLVIVLVAIALISILMISSSANGGVANAFGYSLITIEDTGSMEPFFGSNDLVIIEQRDASDLNAGDIISFYGIVSNQRGIITHRIVQVYENADGTYYYETKGDAYDLPDQSENNVYRQPYIYPDDIIGVYVTHIPGLGSVFSFVKSPTGILVCLVIPLGIFFVFQLVRVIRMAFAMHKESVAAKSAQMKEDEKQRVIEEYLRQQQEAQAASSVETPPSEE